MHDRVGIPRPVESTGHATRATLACATRPTPATRPVPPDLCLCPVGPPRAPKGAGRANRRTPCVPRPAARSAGKGGSEGGLGSVEAWCGPARLLQASPQLQACRSAAALQAWAVAGVAPPTHPTHLPTHLPHPPTGRHAHLHGARGAHRPWGGRAAGLHLGVRHVEPRRRGVHAAERPAPLPPRP